MQGLQYLGSMLKKMWAILTTSPQSFKGGAIWKVITTINGALGAIGTALLVLFFTIGVIKTCGSFAELKKPETTVKVFVRFVLAKYLINNCLKLLKIHHYASVALKTYRFFSSGRDAKTYCCRKSVSHAGYRVIYYKSRTFFYYPALMSRNATRSVTYSRKTFLWKLC